MERIGLTCPAFKRLSQFAANNNSMVGQDFLSRILVNEGKIEEAKIYAKKAADQGHDEAQVFLGSIFVKEHNFKDAKYHLEKAVQGRSCSKYVDEKDLRPSRGYAFYSLSLIAYEEGVLDKAREYDQQGANLGNPICQYNFAETLEKEDRIDDAVRYLQLSAQQGFQPAIELLPAMIARSKRTAGAG